jgi:small subunit ribosomal protein S2
MPYLAERWPGGMLTNFNTILVRLRYLAYMEEKLSQSQGVITGLTKKESLNLKRELEKLNLVFEGVKKTRRLPDALFVADIVKENIAVREAKRLGIPVIGIADSNANPDIEYPIPGNDDAVRSVKYIVDKISEVISQNKKDVTAAAEKETPKTASDPLTKKVQATEETESIASPQLSEEEKKFDQKEMKWEEEAVVKKSRPAEEVATKEKE